MTSHNDIANQDDGNDARSAFEAAVSVGELSGIRSAARRWLTTTTSPTRTAKFIRSRLADHLPAGIQPFRVALLSSFSIELLEVPLWAYGLTESLDIRVYLPGFDQYRQQILDPESGLYSGDHDAIVIAVEGSKWAPALYDRFMAEGRHAGTEVVARAVADIANLVRMIRQRQTTPILFFLPITPRHPQLGIMDSLSPHGQVRSIASLNQALGDLATEIPGFYPVNVEAVVYELGYGQWHDPRLEYSARSPIARTAMDHLARYTMRYFRALAGKSRKCLVLDLDNTLWGGVLGEDGVDGIKLGSEYPGNAYVAFQQALLTLNQRGVLLAAASKNNRQDVDKLFAARNEMVLKPEHFSAMEIHWEAKSVSLQRIAERLNLSLEHLVFVDDNPVECQEVTLALPQVTTVALPSQPERYIEAVFSEGLFDALGFSDEDTRRAALYQQRGAAEQIRRRATTVEDYYRSLDMTVYLNLVTASTLPRAAQLTQKTNQFNATTKRYSEGEISMRMESREWTVMTARLTDCFGDNGVVCLAMAQHIAGLLDIDTFLMSCRVIGRTVETALLYHLVAIARDKGIKTVQGQIIPTARNEPVRDLYERHGFLAVDETEAGDVRWQLATADSTLALPDWLKVVDQTKDTDRIVSF